MRLASGLTVVTGETGAGKTMLVTALELLLGARADAGLVRRGADAAFAEAVISPPPPEAATGSAKVTTELVVSREIPADGRSRARLGGRLAPVSALAEVLGRHVEVHAQHEHVRLTRPEVQRHLLDRYAGDPHARTLATYREAHNGLARARPASRGHLEADARERARELDRLRFELGEIDAAQLDGGGRRPRARARAARPRRGGPACSRAEAVAALGGQRRGAGAARGRGRRAAPPLTSTTPCSTSCAGRAESRSRPRPPSSPPTSGPSASPRKPILDGSRSSRSARRWFGS
jgi:DNA repair protein RecN (Recombination protein N)